MWIIPSVAILKIYSLWEMVQVLVGVPIMILVHIFVTAIDARTDTDNEMYRC